MKKLVISKAIVTFNKENPIRDVQFDRCLILFDVKYEMLTPDDLSRALNDFGVDGCAFISCVYNSLDVYSKCHADMVIKKAQIMS